MGVSPRPEILGLKIYVAGKPIDELKRELGLTDIVKLASNENPLGPSPLAVQAIIEAASTVNLYPLQDQFYLRRKLSQRWGVDMEGIVAGSGLDEMIELIGAAFINPGDEAVVPDPSFSSYDHAVEKMGGHLIKVPLRDYTIDVQAMLDAVTKKTKLVFICNPNNPTGTAISAAEVDFLLDNLPPGVVAVLDEAYAEFVDRDDYPQSINYVKAGRPVIMQRTFSKVYGLAGLRVGYIITTPEIAGYIQRVRGPFNVSSVAQAAAVAALDDEEHVRKTVANNRQGKEYLYREFERLGLPYVPTQTNFLLVDVKRPSQPVFEALLRQGVIVRPGGFFGLPTMLRVSIGTMTENQRFIAALENVLAKGA